MLIIVLAFGAVYTVSGKVTDASGQPVEATVTISCTDEFSEPLGPDA